MYNISELRNLSKNKKILVTGHTGFKGAYLCLLLNYLGAELYGYALKEEEGSLYDIAKIRELVKEEEIADIRDYDKLYNFVSKINPDYIIHMAAQPLVLDSYDRPKYTYDVNVMGTVNLLEAIRVMEKNDKSNQNLISFLNVTTDKVYLNEELEDYAFVEDDKLCGFDPYANSKSCSEMVTYSYKNSFFKNSKFAISTARAGNVIGGGDISTNRIVPDCYRAVLENKKMIVRNTSSIRPYQYVLEPLIMYINILFKSGEDKKYAASYNVGPDKIDCVNTGKIVDLFFKHFGNDKNIEIVKNDDDGNMSHESKFLRLDNSLIKKTFSYKPIFDIEKAIINTAEGYKVFMTRDADAIKASIYKLIESVLEYTA